MSKPRPYPASVQSERAILGILTGRGDLLDEVLAAVSPDDFIRPDHGDLLRLMQAMHRQGQPIDEVTLAAAVCKDGRDERYGGLTYVLSHGEQAPSNTNWRYYCQMVKATKRARDAIDAAEATAEALRDGADPDEAVRAGIERLQAIADASKTKASPITTLRESKEAVVRRMTTGRPDRVRFFDPVVHARIRRMMPGALTVIGATPGTGKTAMAMQIVVTADLDGARCGVIPLEMGHEGVALRAIATSSGVSLGSMVDCLSAGDEGALSHHDWQRIMQDIETTSDRVMICDTPARELSTLRGYARQMDRESRRKSGEGLDLIVVDYAQMIEVRDQESLHIRMHVIAYGLQALASELGCHVVLASQLTRAGEDAEKKGEPLHVSMLFGGGGTNNAADNTILVSKSAQGERLLYIGKARWGESGGPPARFMFDGDHQRFVRPDDFDVSAMFDREPAESDSW